MSASRCAGDIDFAKSSVRVEASYSHGEITTTKGGRGRAVPMVDELAQVLARLGQRGYLCGRDDPVFPGDGGGHMDGSALRRRFIKARDGAGLRPLRFHDLRHTCSLPTSERRLPQLRLWLEHGLTPASKALPEGSASLCPVLPSALTLANETAGANCTNGGTKVTVDSPAQTRYGTNGTSAGTTSSDAVLD